MTPPPPQKETGNVRRQRSQSQKRTQQPMSRQHQRRRLSTFSVITAIGAAETPTFNIVRVALYLAVLVFSIICLGIAVHFQSVLAPTELTRFVPFAIFVTCASMVLTIGLLALTFMRRANPVSVRLEMACLGLVGFFWFSLGIFTATSASADADVECFIGDDNGNEPIEFPGFTTESFQAQYRVLESFALLNAILLLGFLFILLALAMRQHRLGYKHVWLSSVTAWPWFGAGKRPPPKRLPLPVVTREKEKSAKNLGRSGSRHAAPPLVPQRSTSRHQPKSSSRPPAVSAPVRQDSRRTPGSRPPPPKKDNPAMMVWVPPPEKARTRDDRSRPTPSRQPTTRR